MVKVKAFVRSRVGRRAGLGLRRGVPDGFLHPPCPKHWPFLGMLEVSGLPPAILGFYKWLCSSYLFVFLHRPKDIQPISKTVSGAHLHLGSSASDTQEYKHWPPEGQPPSCLL